MGTEKRTSANDICENIGGGERRSDFREKAGWVRGDDRKAIRKKLGDTISITIHDLMP